MKKIFAAAALVTILSANAFSQRFAYVDVEYVLSNIPEYADAQKRLDNLADQWQKEIQAKYDEIQKLRTSYQAEEVLLTDQMKQERQKEIADKEKAAKDLQKQRFGYQGELFQKRQELIQPIQDKVYDAIQKIAGTKAYDFVFDKSSGSVVLYANVKNNISDQVLQSLGYTAKNPPKSTSTSTQTKKTPVDKEDANEDVPAKNVTDPTKQDPEQKAVTPPKAAPTPKSNSNMPK